MKNSSLIENPPQEIMTRSQWNGYRMDFTRHFFNGDTNMPLEHDGHAFGFSLISQLREAHNGSRVPEPSSGLFFTYGYQNGEFIPVLELYGTATNGGIQIIQNTAHLADGTRIAEPVRAAFETRYLNNVWTISDNNGIRRPLKLATMDDRFGDMKGIFYPWKRIDRLFNDNNGSGLVDPVLMINSIGAELSDNDILRELGIKSDPDAPVFRHLLSLHMAHKGTTGELIHLLDDSTSTNYALRAIDYGSVCPISCPPRQSLS